MPDEHGICGVLCAAGRHGEPLACGFPKGHKGKHAWATLPTFANGVSVGPDSFEAGVKAAAKKLRVLRVQPAVKGHWVNAGYAVEHLLERGDLKPRLPKPKLPAREAGAPDE